MKAAPVQIDFPSAAAAVSALLADAVARYAKLHASPATATAHPKVTRLDLDVYLGKNASATLHFDTSTTDWPGDGTHPSFSQMSFPNWERGFETTDTGQYNVRLLDGSVRTISAKKFDQTFHRFFVDVLLAARKAGVFEALPKTQLCEMGVAKFECGYFWPDEDDRGLVNLVDPRQPPQALSTEPRKSDSQRAADDEQVYDVWIEAGKATTAQAIAALNSLLGTGLSAAKASLGAGLPIARDVKAPEVQRLAKPLRRAGMNVLIDPEFRWRLD